MTKSELDSVKEACAKIVDNLCPHKKKRDCEIYEACAKAIRASQLDHVPTEVPNLVAVDAAREVSEAYRCLNNAKKNGSAAEKAVRYRKAIRSLRDALAATTQIHNRAAP